LGNNKCRILNFLIFEFLTKKKERMPREKQFDCDFDVETKFGAT
jgi:hypothetical protein